MKRVIATILLLATTASLIGCATEPARPSYCYWYPGSCR